ncbi:MAG: ABC transporter ATP-binding protein [Eubacteriales bacterium]|nr:ABC transporter ATP-binding protein [Eubacteriales bacterium]MDD4421887.1 ABC transporter ATP-binding protein [Eubacteriales bacterium]HBR31368.1 ABC transporter ATP-binding protein [Clostridiales bacterium]
MIKLNNINKYYKIGKNRFHALKNVSLEIKDGEFVSIEGKSGAGKSTLVHIIGCLDNFDSGSYILDGVSVGDMKESALSATRNSKIGFVMQDFALISHESVIFNVMLPLYFSKIKYNMKSRAYDMLEQVGIADQALKSVNQLSGGQKQRVAIARALITGCSIIVADEPTGALDTKTSEEIMDLLININQSAGTTVIVVTHDPTVSAAAERKIIISDGIIKKDIMS